MRALVTNLQGTDDATMQRVVTDLQRRVRENAVTNLQGLGAERGDRASGWAERPRPPAPGAAGDRVNADSLGVDARGHGDELWEWSCKPL